MTHLSLKEPPRRVEIQPGLPRCAVSPTLKPNWGSCYNVLTKVCPHTSVPPTGPRDPRKQRRNLVHVLQPWWSGSPLHLWPHLQLLFLSFIPLQIHWPPCCSSTCQETHASGPWHLLFPLPLPQIAALRSPCAHWFLFKCPLPRETFLGHVLKLLVLYHSIFYLPAMLSFFSITHITSTTQILLILLIVCLTPSPRCKLPEIGMLM